MKFTPFPSLPRAATALCSAVMAGCSTVPVETAAPVLSRPENSDQLSRGRQLYVTRCAKCHQVYPVRNYTSARWGPIMTEMAEDAKLDAAEESAVRAYVAAVLKSPG